MPQQKPDFSAVMARSSDVELAEVLLRPGDYTPEALTAARAELLKRKTSVQELVERREDAVRVEVSRHQSQKSGLAGRGLWLGIGVSAVITMIAGILQLLEKKPSIAGFAESEIELGVSFAIFGVFIFGFAFKLLLRVPKQVQPMESPNQSLSEIRSHHDRTEALTSSFVFAVSLIGGGLGAAAIGVLCQ